MPFQSGQSGNPATQFRNGNPGGPGRPKKRDFVALCEKVLEQEYITILSKDEKTFKKIKLPDGMDAWEYMAGMAVRRACGGDFKFFQELVNRTQGKVPDRVAGHDGGPLDLQFDTFVQILVEVTKGDPVAKQAVAAALERMTANGQYEPWAMKPEGADESNPADSPTW